MRNFLLGVAVGATGMGLYTGYIKIDIPALNQKSDKPTQGAPTVPPTPRPEESL